MKTKRGITCYGKELVLDLSGCDPYTFTRDSIEKYFISLCIRINMEREDLHFWDYEGDKKGYEKAPDHLKGTSAIQFIRTSNITIHTLDKLKRVFLNIFSCKDFNEDDVIIFSKSWFKSQIEYHTILHRGVNL